MIKPKSGYNQTLKWIQEFEKVNETLKIELAQNQPLLQIELKGIESQLSDLRKQAYQSEVKF